MCGITGLYRPNRNISTADVKVVGHMTTSLAHRGPDAEGFFHQESCAFGHRRLAIIDLDQRSNQPLTDHSGRYTIIFNGQVYNFQDIKAELLDYPFKTESDTEVVVAAFARWGENCLARFNGMFAFAIYDAVKNILFLARDRFGVKPLYYFQSADVFLFASELRTLLSTGLIPNKLCHAALEEYFLYQAPASPHSIVENIYQLPAAHYAFVSGGRMKISSYWSFGSTEQDVPRTYKEAVSHVRVLLQGSVRRRMISDVPLGAFLSGGIDSSAIVALMSQVESPINTFSIVFQEADYDESVFSDMIAMKYATQHHKLLLSPDQFLQEVPNALDAMDSPSADGVNTYVVSKLTRNAGVTVAMSGLGGDELFAGYHNFRVWRNLNRLGFFKIPAVMRRALTSAYVLSANETTSERVKILAEANGSITKGYPSFRQVMGNKLVSRLMKEKTAQPGHSRSNGWIEKFQSISQFSIAELTNYTQNVLLKDTDQFSMASALEIREPFFDHRLVDYVISLPDKWKIGRVPKQLLCDALGELLPAEVAMRKKKGFLFPWQLWLRNELSPMVEDHIQFLADHETFDGNTVQNIWAEFKRGATTPWSHVWQLVVLSQWMRKNLEF